MSTQNPADKPESGPGVGSCDLLGEKPQELAYKLFVRRATRAERSWFGEIVQENLNGYLASGCTPEQAVERLFRRVSAVERRR